MRQLFIDNREEERFIRAAMCENGAVCEFCAFDKENAGNIGNIYLARITRVLPSKFVFLDLGQGGRNAFLHLRDYKERYIQKPPKQGDSLLVQVIKDETDIKGACVTTQISFANKLLVVFLNGGGEINISQRISDNAERKRLKKIIKTVLPASLGVIVRTQAAGLTLPELNAAINPLIQKALQTAKKTEYAAPPLLINEQANALIRTADRLLTRDTEKITLYETNEYPAFLCFIKETFAPLNPDDVEQTASACPLPVIELYDKNKTPLFSNLGIEAEFEKAFNKKVWLKSGGFLIIEQTEAAVCIDVNSGKNTNGNYETTVRVTNREAAYEAARQIRLRNLSGLILIDFINPQDKQETSELKDELNNALMRDRIPIKIASVTDFGVFLLLRKKTYNSLDTAISKAFRF